MKSFLKATLTLLVLLFACVLTFTACDEKDHEHAWSEWNTVENASCTKEGKQERSCSCGEKETNVISKTDHAFTPETTIWHWDELDFEDEKILVPATLVCSTDNSHIEQTWFVVQSSDVLTPVTCQSKGACKYTAQGQINGVIYKSEKIVDLEKIGHTEVIDATVSASCMTAGLTEGKHCSVCNEILISQQEIPALGHNYDMENISWVCEELPNGGVGHVTAYLMCKNDSSHISEIAATTSGEETLSPTCTTTGVYTYTSSIVVDGVTYTTHTTSTIAKTEHNWDVWIVTTPATPTASGEKTHTCLGCGETKKETFAYPITQNEWSQAFNNLINSTNMTIDSSATMDGLTGKATVFIADTKIYQNSTYDKESQEFYIVRENNVDYVYYLSEGIWIKEVLDETTVYSISATLPLTVWEQFRDAYNGFIYDGNSYVASELTISFKMNDEDFTVSEIAFVITDGVVTGLELELTAQDNYSQTLTMTFRDIGKTVVTLPHIHEWSDWVVETEVTCTANGLKKRTCDCGEEETEIIYTQGHNYEVIVTAPTCEEQGYTTYTCSACVSSYIGLYTDALGHSWGEWEVKETNTVRYCDNDCGDYQRITYISASYHGIRLLTGESVWGDDVTVVATLSDNSIISIDDFTLENDVVTVDGANYVTVNFKTLSTTFSVPAIYNNLPGTTSTSEFTYTEEDDAITITGFIGSSTDIIIPAHINRVPVRYIGESAFNGQENIKSVVIPDSIYSVGEEAFNGCIRVASVSFGSGLTSIGSLAFYNCISLTEVTIPANVITIDGYWNGGAFENCTGLKKVIIGDASTEVATTIIGERAFYNCTALTEVFIGNQVKSIGKDAFNGCSTMTTLTIGSEVQTIGEYAFRDCEALVSVVIPDSVITIGEEAFYNCKRIASVTFGKGLTIIGSLAFYNCISLTEVTIPTNVITIDGYWNGGAFENCTGLKKVTIGDDTVDIATTTIGERAFYNCTALTEVFIGNQVKSIGKDAFNGCSTMTTLTIGSEVQTIGEYAFHNCEALVSVVIPDSVITIGEEAFYNCKRMASVTFGKGLTTIGSLAFYNCISLTEVAIPANVITIDGYWNGGAFENCTGLKNVTIGDDTVDIATTTIGERAFYNCTALTEVFIGNQVKSIGKDSFNGCSAMTTVTIGTNVQTIGAYAFRNCEALTSVVIPDSVITIEEEAFYNCKRITSVEFGKGLTTIGSLAFYNCISLTEVTIPANVITIDGYWNGGAFENCTGLKKVTIGDDTVDIAVTTIGERAFANCTSLAEVYIGSNVKTIADNAFEGCVSLTDVQLGTGAQSVGSYAFSGCTDLTSITIPSNIMSLGNDVFNGCTSLETVTIEKGKELLRSFGSNVFSDCTSFDRVYYTGTADDWSLITISEKNCYPLNVTPYYYSESKPTTVDNYWYYNGNGAKRVWNVSETSFDAEYSSENFVELFGGEDSSYSTTFFNELDNDSNFKSGLYAWEALHMIADTSFSEGVWKVSKKDLYKLVIFDLLCGETNAQETIFDAFDTSTVAYIDDMAGAIFGEKATHDFLKSISPKLDYSTKLVDYNVIGLQYIFESHSNMYDALKSCATYLVLADMDESFQTVLLQIANDSSNPWELREAAREYAEIFKMSASQILANYAVEYYTSDVRAAFTIFSDLLWDKTVEMVFPEFAVAQSIAKGILFLADLGCNIDGIYMAYYKLDVAVHLEASLRKIIHNTQPDYFRVSNRANSEIYVYAVDMYKTSVLLGFDYSNNLLSEDCEKKSDEEKEAYIAIMNNISSMKADKQILYNSFDTLVSQAYIAYYQN